MPYCFIDTIAIADAAFEATGSTLEEVLLSAWDAALITMVENPESIEMKSLRRINIAQREPDLLLHDFLQKLIFYKDAEGEILRVKALKLMKRKNLYELDVQLSGEPIDPSRHQMNVDVKAVTFYRLAVEEMREGWRATVVLDI
jgi:SHS2 domain-containing protein